VVIAQMTVTMHQNAAVLHDANVDRFPVGDLRVTTAWVNVLLLLPLVGTLVDRDRVVATVAAEDVRG
jgi:hypothetical protein